MAVCNGHAHGIQGWAVSKGCLERGGQWKPQVGKHRVCSGDTEPTALDGPVSYREVGGNNWRGRL